jgi:hypothetical protein
MRADPEIDEARDRMRQAVWSAVFLLSYVLMEPLPAADMSALAGTWQGPWYRGMTSGQMTLEVAADGTGKVAFTNLETFGDAPAGVHKAEFSGQSIRFSANGASGSEFAARGSLIPSNQLLRGTARYEGFPVKFDLRRR